MRFVLSCLLTLAFVAPAAAQVNIIDTRVPRMAPAIKGIVTPVSQITTVSPARLGDQVTLEGRLIEAPSCQTTNYLLQDTTGTVPLRIDDRMVENILNTNELVRIKGTIENKGAGERSVNATIVELRPEF